MKNAIIIGAGPAGLTAAYYMLKETDIHPIIIEKEDYVGGIARTVEYKGNRMDIGGHRFFSKNREITDLWEELMPLQGKPAMDDKMLKRECQLKQEGPDPEKDDKVMLNRHRISRIMYMKRFFDYPISLGINTIMNLGVVRLTVVVASYIKALFIKRPENNLENFMINRFGKRLYNMFFKDYTHKVWGRYPKEIDADWGSQRIKGISLCKVISHLCAQIVHMRSGSVETSLIDRFYYPKYGPGQLWDTMKEEIEKNGGEIYFNNEVKEISRQSDKVTYIKTKNGSKTKVWEADYILSSMPIKELIKDINDDTIQQDVKEVADGLIYRDFITVGLLVDRLKIKNTTRIRTLGNNIPDCWIYVQEPDVEIGRLQIFNNWSPYLLKDPINKVWLGLEYFCHENDEKWSMSDEDFIKFAVGELEQIGVISKDDVEDSVCVHVPKAYPAYFGRYKEFQIVKSYLDSIDNLYCIGRNGQHRYNNMDHSMLTAIEAVRAINDPKYSKSNIWNVNTEKEYHEN
ncbi:NAD(P)/FAD-dependent oxidoreductase [Selenomonas ruminantium]|uniref:Protoporphyrinogen oxidase n=1 Tax=Selenomonas ruminantium TaxID=971 RepID=A0A1H3YUV1_SELRU|nr:NAD(P)/FAD-dependent oxidoreductase [Selenomonas ruminantium]SEA14868.1 Protoporphyrinogen oxidase [Selenomonas ruminantium]